MMKNLVLAACGITTMMSMLPIEEASARYRSRYRRGRDRGNNLARVKDEGFQSPIHKKYAGKLIFSKKRIARGPRSEKGFTNSFTLRDKIYVRPMLAESMGNSMRKIGVACYKMRRRITKVQIGNAPEKQWVWLEGKPTHKSNWNDWMTYSLDSDGKNPLNHGPTYWPKDKNLAKYRFGARLLTKLSAGTHKLTFHVIAECYGKTSDGYKTKRFTVAKSAITLKVTKKSLRRHLKRKGPFLVRSKNRGMHRMMMRVVRKKWRNEKVLGATSLAKKWRVYRHRYLRRRILRRSFFGGVVVRKRGAKRCRVFNLTFSQKSLNYRSRYGKTQLYVGSSHDIPCVNARR